jgi:hypothetical protein
MSFIHDIFDLVKNPQDSDITNYRESTHMTENVFNKAKEIIDKYYENNDINIIHHKDELSHGMCGFWDLINLPDNFFKLIFEYCLEKKYIIINTELEHSLCRKLIRIHVDNYNIQIILWLIENVISSVKLNEFLFDYNNDKDYIEPITKKEHPQRYFSLLQLFFNNQFYDTDIYLTQIFHVFKQKKFNFLKVSESCCRSLLVSAIDNWDIYSVRVLLSEGCKFDEDCYDSLTRMIRRNLCTLRDVIDDNTKSPKNNNDGTWSYVTKFLYEKIYEDDEMLIKIFCPENVGYDKKDDSEQNKELIQIIEKYSDEKLSHLEYYESMKKSIITNISSFYVRSHLVRPEKSLQNIYEIMKLCISYGIDLTYECHIEQQNKYYTLHNYQLSHPTLLNGYLHGCKPYKLIYPEWHEKFVRLLTPK